MKILYRWGSGLSTGKRHRPRWSMSCTMPRLSAAAPHRVQMNVMASIVKSSFMFFSVLYRVYSPKKRTVKCCVGRPWMRRSTRRLSGPMLWRTRRRKIDAIGGIVPPICLNLTFIFGQPAEILKISPPSLADPKMGCYTRPISADRDTSAHGRFILCYTKDKCVVSGKKLL